MDNLEYLNAAFDAAKRSGKVHTSKDFAELIGVDRATISSALNGNKKYLTEKLVQRVQRVLEYNKIVVSPSSEFGDVVGVVADNGVGVQKNFGMPPQDDQNRVNKLLDLLKEKDMQMNRLLTIIETLTNNSK